MNEEAERIVSEQAGISVSGIHGRNSRGTQGESSAEKRNARQPAMARLGDNRSEEHDQHPEPAEHKFRRYSI
jgi:hypothetical protein